MYFSLKVWSLILVIYKGMRMDLICLYQSESYLQGKICLRVHQIRCNLLVLEHHHSAVLDEAADPLRGWFLINH